MDVEHPDSGFVEERHCEQIQTAAHDGPVLLGMPFEVARQMESSSRQFVVFQGDVTFGDLVCQESLSMQNGDLLVKSKAGGAVEDNRIEEGEGRLSAEEVQEVGHLHKAQKLAGGANIHTVHQSCLKVLFPTNCPDQFALADLIHSFQSS